jgi:hypothetical protein
MSRCLPLHDTLIIIEDTGHIKYGPHTGWSTRSCKSVLKYFIRDKYSVVSGNARCAIDIGGASGPGPSFLDDIFIVSVELEFSEIGEELMLKWTEIDVVASLEVDATGN